MKNRLIKGAHLSEKKCREILQLFCEDLTATQIANICGVSRVTVNNYLKLIRTHIAKFCEENNPKRIQNGYLIYIPLESRNGRNGDQVHENHNLRIYYGFVRHEGKIFTDWLEDLNKNSLQQLQRARLGTDGTDTIPDHLARYYAIADFSDWRLYRLDTRETISSTRPVFDDISGFWGHTKSRLLKFRGLNKNTLYLHVKECEFRYNFRNEDLLGILMNIIDKKPPLALRQ